MSEHEKLKAMIWLLEQEVQALRSVLSEWPEDKSHFTQMQKADVIQELFNHLVR